MEFLENYTFKYPWRNYQAKVLKELEIHLLDNKINVIAAPGAGKTVLGLEIVRRINKNVLILSPTITIKNQWVDRFLELFVQTNPAPDFISTDIYNLSRFNVATYQALHYAYNRKKIVETLDGEEENEKEANAISFEYDLIGELNANNIEVVVLDEAHHLRSAWWKSLTDVLKSLNNIKTIALTATPPYDAEKSEWDKYLEVCGAVDCEITVPELVATGDLCAHQDFVIFNKLSPEEEQQVTQINAAFDEFVTNLKMNNDFISAVANMAQLNDYATNEENILDNPQYYSSLLVFLNEVGVGVNREIASALGGSSPVPPLNAEWLEIMLQGILYDDKDFISANKNIVKVIHSQLDKIGGILKGKVSIQANDEIKRIMAGSIGKMGSIAEIVLNEHATLGTDLSMVILTDYVRSEALKDDTVNKIGVVPIFKRIVKDIGITPDDDNVIADKIANIAVLSGKLKIIPKTFIPLIEGKVSCEFNDITIAGYVEIKTSSKYENELVSIITNLMNEKRINIIIGTVALLGEGWDCQAVNSLVLASFVGSFMLSNQMRGRAIRSNKTKNKIANIWHLVSLTKNEYDNKRISINNMDLSDYLILKRRFKSFLGIAYNSNSLQNGINRLDVMNGRNFSLEFEEINKQMYRISRTRQNTKKRWIEILDMFGGENIQIVHTLKSDLQKERRFKPMAISEIKSEVKMAIPTFVGWGSLVIGMLDFPNSIYLFIFGTFISLFVTGKFLRSLFRIARYFSPVKNMRKIGQIVLMTLKDQGYMKSEKAVSNVKVSESDGVKEYETELLNSTVNENNLFIQCMREIYERVDNPRYIIAFEDKRGIATAYFNVPSIFTDNKAKAEQFHKLWQTQMGNCKLIYTRTADGRKTLFTARKGSFDYSDWFSQQQQAVKYMKWK